ncbi:ubiquitin-like domain-containing CTD phosphatase 1, partial [Sitodiplosis mosellana]|uniref:ubiquitin-like domain-containing CTD phosphatase 1 n=1 Tax=Sitodiplosis mosellana TaxID=263140 RepID=UPI002444DA8B
MTSPKDVSIIVKWNGKEYPITNISRKETVAMLKHKIAELTNVQPERQKLLNLKYKGKVAADDLRLSSLELKLHFKLMMVGSREADIQDVQNLINNQDISDDNDEPTTCDHNGEPTSSMNDYELKRKSQHETAEMSEGQKVIEYKETPTRFDDLCDDVIDSILYLLELQDLAYVSDVNKQLRNIAGSVFSRKYGNHLISIDRIPKTSK